MRGIVESPGSGGASPYQPSFRFVLPCEATPMISLGSIGRPILCLWGMTPYAQALSKAPAQAELRPTSPSFRFVLPCEATPMISLGTPTPPTPTRRYVSPGTGNFPISELQQLRQLLNSCSPLPSLERPDPPAYPGRWLLRTNR
jgi:hypothetical protein